MPASFKSTVNPPTFRRLVPSDALLVDPTSGAPIGLQNPNANGFDGQFYPVPLTAAQIAAPTAAMLADLNVTFCLNVAPYTRYMSNGSELVSVAGGPVSRPLGVFANLSTIPSGMPALTIDANSQSLIYAPLTIQSTGGLTTEGTLRVQSWPT